MEETFVTCTKQVIKGHGSSRKDIRKGKLMCCYVFTYLVSCLFISLYISNLMAVYFLF